MTFPSLSNSEDLDEALWLFESRAEGLFANLPQRTWVGNPAREFSFLGTSPEKGIERDMTVHNGLLWALLLLNHPQKTINLGPCLRCAAGRWVPNKNHNRLLKDFRGANGEWRQIPGQGAHLARISNQRPKIHRDPNEPAFPLCRRQKGKSGLEYRLRCCHGYGERVWPVSDVFLENVDHRFHDEHLAVLADQFQAEGNPLGLLLALNLQNTRAAREEAEPLLLEAMQNLLKPR